MTPVDAGLRDYTRCDLPRDEWNSVDGGIAAGKTVFTTGSTDGLGCELAWQSAAGHAGVSNGSPRVRSSDLSGANGFPVF